MFLHAQRIILPNPVETIDLCSEDPFTGLDLYRETEVIHEFNSDVYEIFEDKTITWEKAPS
jgi:hypothetical protein